MRLLAILMVISVIAACSPIEGWPTEVPTGLHPPRKQCAYPTKPIQRERLEELAKAEILRREKTHRYSQFEISWAGAFCGWNVIASPMRAAPGDDRMLLYSNDGKLVSYIPGI